jgi:hypothetical protein
MNETDENLDDCLFWQLSKSIFWSQNLSDLTNRHRRSEKLLSDRSRVVFEEFERTMMSSIRSVVSPWHCNVMLD